MNNPYLLYKEALDNQLIIGANILAAIHVYNCMVNLNKFLIEHPNIHVSKVDVLNFIWAKKAEAIFSLSKYYLKHAEECAKFEVETHSRAQLQRYCDNLELDEKQDAATFCALNKGNVFFDRSGVICTKHKPFNVYFFFNKGLNPHIVSDLLKPSILSSDHNPSGIIKPSVLKPFNLHNFYNKQIPCQ